MAIGFAGLDDLMAASKITQTNEICQGCGVEKLMSIRGVVQERCHFCLKRREDQEFQDHEYRKFLDGEANSPALPEAEFYKVIKNLFFRRNVRYEADTLRNWYDEFGQQPGGKVKRVASSMASSDQFLSPANFAKLGGFKFVEQPTGGVAFGNRVYFKGAPEQIELDGKSKGGGE